jgi:hypothetical protein
MLRDVFTESLPSNGSMHYIIKIDFTEVGCGGMDWRHLALGYCGYCEHGNGPSGSIN